MEAAPYHADLAEGPENAAAWWLRAPDGVRIRIGVWPEGTEGTVLIFPGRTEFVEKYARVGEELRARGFASLAIDWRGQGLADRLADDPMVGHVAGEFTDYQRDVDAVLEAARALDLPEPFFLLGHSMGGAIGLRTLTRPVGIAAAAFSGPMWGIAMSSHLRPVAWAVPRVAKALGFGVQFAPGIQRESYLATAPFEGNTLTSDESEFARIQKQTAKGPEFALGGPSLHWLHAALEEIRALNRMPLPAVPALAAVGDGELIADKDAIRALAGRWPSCTFHEYKGARHELLMERPEVRLDFIGRIVDLFRAASDGNVQSA